MPADPLARLRALRRERADQLFDALQEDAPDPARVAALGDLLRLTDGLLAERAVDRSASRRRTLVAGLAVAAVLSVAAMWRTPDTPFTLDVEATSAELEMAEDGDLSQARIDAPLRVEGYGAFTTSPGLLPVGVSRDTPGAFVLSAPTTLLRRATWPRGARLRFDAGPDRTRITISGARPRAGVVVEATGRGSLRVDGQDLPVSADFGSGGWMEMSTAPAPAAGRSPAPPLSVAFDAVAGRALAWDALRPAGLRFLELRPRVDGRSEESSSLVKASLSLPAVDRSATFGRGDGLAMEGLHVTHGELTLGPTVHLVLAGTASDVRMLAGAKWRSLQPSWLEFLARNHAVALFWSAAGFLWAARQAMERTWRGGSAH